MVAWCTVTGDRVDVLEWTDWLTAYDRVLADGFSPFHGGRPLVVMPLLLISAELGFEYPDKAWDLATALDEAGFGPRGHPHRAGQRDHRQQGPAESPRSRPTRRPRAARSAPEPGDEEAGAPLLTALLIGTPSRRVGDVRLTHLAAWSLGDPGRVLAGAYADFRRKPGDRELLGEGR